MISTTEARAAPKLPLPYRIRMNTKSLLHSRLGWLIAAAALVFASGCAYLETKQGDWIFNPAQGAWRGYRGPPAGVEEVWIPVGTKGEKLHAWWSPQPDQDAPVLDRKSTRLNSSHQ